MLKLLHRVVVIVAVVAVTTAPVSLQAEQVDPLDEAAVVDEAEAESPSYELDGSTAGIDTETAVDAPEDVGHEGEGLVISEDGIDAEEPQGEDEEALQELVVETSPALSVSYATHVQNVGWQAPVTDGVTSGTSGRGLRLEALTISLEGDDMPSGGIEYRTQVQNKGWSDWVSDGSQAGTTGSSLRLEALQVRLYGEVAESFDVFYRVHVQNHGWLEWACDGELAGSTGRSLRLEAVQVVVVPKGAGAPAANPVAQESVAFIDGSGLSVVAHVQNRGWLRAVGSGKVAGTTGKSLRVEALRVSLTGSRVPGGVEGQAHVQNVGWRDWHGNGQVVGTTGRGLRVEAVRYQLTGEAADEWDLYYCAHVQNVGWLGWAANGAPAGTEGMSLRVEAVEFRLVEKGAAAPPSLGSSNNAFMGPVSISVTTHDQAYGWGPAGSGSAYLRPVGEQVSGISIVTDSSSSNVSGGVRYDLRTEGGEWLGWAADGEKLVSDTGLTAMRVELTDGLASSNSVFYRVHVDGLGWLGWARDGQTAGSDTHVITGLEVRLGKSSDAAPSGELVFYDQFPTLSGDEAVDCFVWDSIARNGWEGEDGLRAAYDMVRSMPLRSSSHWPGPAWETWSVTFAREMLERNGGNCYRYAALIHWFAKALGFDSRTVPGRLGTGSDHGWCEVTIDGVPRLLDAAVHNAYPEYDWYLQTYEEARLRYYGLDGNRII